MHFSRLHPQAKPLCACGIEGFGAKKKLDNPSTPPYPTPSMSTPSSPDILEWGLSQAQLWAERGDLTDAGEEEGC